MAMDADIRQIIAFYIGDRSKLSAKELWKLIQETYRKNATFYTDNWKAYKSVYLFVPNLVSIQVVIHRLATDGWIISWLLTKKKHRYANSFTNFTPSNPEEE